MTTKHLAHVAIVTLLASLTCVPAAWTQQAQQQKDKDPRVNPPVEPLPSITSSESSSRTPQAATLLESAPAEPAAQRPHTSVEGPSLESSGTARTLILPSFSLYQGGDSNPVLAGNSSGIDSIHTFSGRLLWQRVSPHSEFLMDYSGGGTIHSRRTDQTHGFHAFGLSERWSQGRWVVFVQDQVSYTPEARFGFSGVVGQNTGVLGSGGTFGNVGEQISPSQSIITGVSRISNTLVGEVQYQRSPRSVFTFSGSYGLLRFSEQGLIESDEGGFRFGYNYQLTGKNSLSVMYGLDVSRFGIVEQGFDAHSFRFGYQRRISGRLSVSVSSGPQLSTFRNPLAGADQRVSWSVDTTLLYERANTSLSIAYLRGMTGGSGLFVGAQTDQVQATISRPLSRLWRISGDFGYARNAQLKQTGGLVPDRIINSWFVTVRTARPMGRYANLYFQYQLQRQQSSLAAGDIGFRHVFGIGFNFRLRPIDVD